MSKKTVHSADVDVFTAIAHPVRRQLLTRLMPGELTANELAEPFGISRSAVSQHLSILTEAGLVSRTKRGRERVYQLRLEGLSEVQRWMDQFAQMWPEKLDALESLLDELEAEEADSDEA